MSSSTRQRERPRRFRILPRNTAFRIALTFLLLFGSASTFLMGGVYLATSRFFLAQIDQSIEDDITQLIYAGRHFGPHGLARRVVRQVRLAGEARSVFLLAGPDHVPLAGNLAEWPAGMPEGGWTILPRETLRVVPLTDIPGGEGHFDPIEREQVRRAVREATGRPVISNDFAFSFEPRRPQISPLPRIEGLGPITTTPMTPSRLPPPQIGQPWGPFASIDAPEARTPMDFQLPPPPSEAAWLFGPFGPFGRSEPFMRTSSHDLADGGSSFSAVRAVSLTLPGGFSLLVGRDLEPIITLRTRMARAIKIGLLAMAALGLIGGIAMSSRVSRRLDAINRTSRQIMAGDLTRRVPEGAGLEGDDFDLLAVNLNTMLSRIEALMAGVRHVSDTIAHDLRTPLARLRNRLEDLSEHTDSDDCREGLQHALGEVDGLLATFNALLRIAQIESGGRRMAFSSLDLVPVMEDVSDLYDAVAMEHLVTLSVNLPESAWVDGDRDLLFQAFANLLDNAVKYTPEGGGIRMTVTNMPGLSAGRRRIRVVIDDEGPGIPPEDRDRVFERFTRLDEARATPGNGLGLTMVGAVIDAHGGAIILDEAPGGGLRVIVDLYGGGKAPEPKPAPNALTQIEALS